MTTSSAPEQSVPAGLQPRWGLAAVTALGLVVAAILAAYSRVHPGNGAAIITFGFRTLLAMKTWLTTAALVFLVVQLISALAMWGRLPGISGSPSWASPVHRWSGVVAFLITLPVAFQCIWSLGFSDSSARTVAHSIAGCLFYGVFAAKMLSLRLHRLPGWTLPVLGGLLSAVLVVVWFTSAFWYFTASGLPLW